MITSNIYGLTSHFHFKLTSKTLDISVKDGDILMPLNVQVVELLLLELSLYSRNVVVYFSSQKIWYYCEKTIDY